MQRVDQRGTEFGKCGPSSVAVALIAALGMGMVGCANTQSASSFGPWVNTNLIADGPEKELCDAVFAHLMTLRPECRADGIETYPGFSEPPWQEINAAEHRQLLQTLLRYERIIQVPSVEDGLTDPMRYWQMRADEFLAEGGKMRVWRTSAIAAGVDGNRLRKMVELVHYIAVEPNPCPGPTTNGIKRATFIVDDAMKGPAPDVNPDLARLLADGAVVLNRSELLRINSYFVGRMTGNICYFSTTPRQPTVGPAPNMPVNIRE